MKYLHLGGGSGFRKEGRLRDFDSDKERGSPTNPKVSQTYLPLPLRMSAELP